MALRAVYGFGLIVGGVVGMRRGNVDEGSTGVCLRRRQGMRTWGLRLLLLLLLLWLYRCSGGADATTTAPITVPIPATQMGLRKHRRKERNAFSLDSC